MLRNQANRRGSLLALIFLLLLASAADAELLPIKAYTIADGLPHYEINKIVRDSRGFLWLCTADGLSRFDGYTFANFSTDQGLPHRQRMRRFASDAFAAHHIDFELVNRGQACDFAIWFNATLPGAWNRKIAG